MIEKGLAASLKVLDAFLKVLGAFPKGLAAALKVLAAFPKGLAAFLTGLAAFAIVLNAQGRIANAKIETRTITQSLEREVQAIADRGAATWIGYRVPMIPGQRRMCCYDSISPDLRVGPTSSDWGGACRLESGGGITMTGSDPLESRGSLVVVEPPGDVVILARVEARAITRIRTFTPDCDLDGGGMPVVWLENVSPADSAAWLTALARATGGGTERDTRVVQTAIAALALHPGQPSLRTLVALARDDQRANVRNQALFWLGQRAGQEAVATITNAINNDPETEVKKRAVFALSRMPKDEGVPLLINVARTNRNPEVRKQAMFWLGQSRDPRAVSFFEEILKAK